MPTTPRTSDGTTPEQAASTRQDVKLRDYTSEEIAEFIRDDQLDEQARATAERFSAIMDGHAPQGPDLDGPATR